MFRAVENFRDTSIGIETGWKTRLIFSGIGTAVVSVSTVAPLQTPVR
jgi:hypothetical protein